MEFRKFLFYFGRLEVLYVFRGRRAAGWSPISQHKWPNSVAPHASRPADFPGRRAEDIPHSGLRTIRGGKLRRWNPFSGNELRTKYVDGKTSITDIRPLMSTLSFSATLLTTSLSSMLNLSKRSLGDRKRHHYFPRLVFQITDFARVLVFVCFVNQTRDVA